MESDFYQSSLPQVTPEQQLVLDLIGSPEELRSRLERVLDNLSDQERTTIEMLYGLVDGKRCLLKEVIKKFSIGEQHARTLRGRALKKLGQPSNLQWLMGLVEAKEPFPLDETEKAFLGQPIGVLRFSSETRQLIARRSGIETILDLIRYSATDLLEDKDFRHKHLTEVRKKLEKIELKLRAD